MSYNLQNLKPVHRTVARYLVSGISLPEICSDLGLNLDTWQQVTSSALFKQQLEQLHNSADDDVIEEVKNDPVLLTLKLKAKQAAERLIAEMSNMEDSANSMSRIKAANSILDRLGYNSQPVTNQPQAIVITLTSEQADAIKKQKVLQEQPASVTA